MIEKIQTELHRSLSHDNIIHLNMKNGDRCTLGSLKNIWDGNITYYLDKITDDKPQTVAQGDLKKIAEFIARNY